MTKARIHNTLSATDICEQFCRYVDYIHGTYLDATIAMGNMASWYMEMDQKRWKELEDSGEALTWDIFNPEVVYNGHIQGKETSLHSVRLHDIIARNCPDGSNWQFLALMCVVALYQIWDDNFRTAIATALNKKPSDLQADIFGEMRHFRHSIIHHMGYATPGVARVKLMRAFKEKSPIILKPQDLHDLTEMVKEAARSFVRS